MTLDDTVIQSMVRLIEVKDASTAAHTWRVVLYARALAERAGLTHQGVEKITRAAALHDLGKIDVPDEILKKPGPLTPDERAIMQTHAAKGHERLLAMGIDCPVMLDLVRHHHERWDGSGYPDALKGEAIGVPARVFAVIDSFDAMTSLRPYRTPAPDAIPRALDELRKGRGSAYWPGAVDLFTDLWDRGELLWIHDHFHDTCAVSLPPFTAAPTVVTGMVERVGKRS